MNTHKSWAYIDENGQRLLIERGAVGTADVTSPGGEPVAVLAEHVPEVCRQLAAKAGASIVVLEAWHLPRDGAPVTLAGGWEIGDDARGHVTVSCETSELSPQDARHIAAALALHADRAEELRRDAEVEELARILRPVTPGMAGGGDGSDYKLTVCRDYARAVLAAGYRKQAQP